MRAADLLARIATEAERLRLALCAWLMSQAALPDVGL